MTIAFSSSRRRALAATFALAMTAGLATAASDAAARPHGDDGMSAPNNPDPIIVEGTPSQSTNRYPSATNLWGADGPITDVNVDLNYVTFGRPADIDILLVSPSGTAVLLFSDACGTSTPVTQAFWTFDDEAPAQMPTLGPCGTGSWQPTDREAGDAFPATAPLGPYQYKLSAFRGENPNGNWQLFVHDDTPTSGGADHGVILQGFRVIITTASQQIVVPGGYRSEGPASQYPFTIPVSGHVGVIEDVNVLLSNLTHSRPDDLDILLVAPGGQKVMLASDSCGHFPTFFSRTWEINDRHPKMSDNGNCNLGGAGGGGIQFAPTDHEPGDVLPAPAPPGPYATSLSVLDGTNPNGEWKVFIHDDYTAHSGYLSNVQLYFELGSEPVDAIAPDTSITTKPASTTTSRRATYGFTSTENGSSFECRLDGGAWTACSSPKGYQRLTFARHTFQVRATDAAGNLDATPAKWVWRVRR